MSMRIYAHSLFFGAMLLAGCGGNSSTQRMSNRSKDESRRASKIQNDKQQVKKQRVEQKKDEKEGQGHAFKELKQKIFTTRKERKKLFKHLGIEYLDYTVIDYAPLLHMNMKSTSRYIKDPVTNNLLTEMYAQDIANHKLVDMSLRWLGQDIGYGVFAEQDIAKDELIGIYTGVVMDRKKIASKDYAWAYPATTVEGTRISLDAKYEGNELRFINHSYNPNSVVRFIIGIDGLWHVCYVASKEIKKGQQILVSYGKKYWQSRQYEYREMNP